jgi:hypothetical protein
MKPKVLAALRVHDFHQRATSIAEAGLAVQTDFALVELPVAAADFQELLQQVCRADGGLPCF